MVCRHETPTLVVLGTPPKVVTRKVGTPEVVPPEVVPPKFVPPKVVTRKVVTPEVVTPHDLGMALIVKVFAMSDLIRIQVVSILPYFRILA